MQVTIKLHGSLRRYRPAGVEAGHRAFTLAVGQETTVEAALDNLDVPGEMVAAIAINGQQAAMDTVLNSGDIIHVFPPAAGG